MNNISEKTHEFRLGNPLSLYSAVLHLVPVDGPMNYKVLSKLVKFKINENKESSKKNLSNDTNESYNGIKRTDHENELDALVLLCKKTICVIFLTKNDQTISSINVHYYDRHPPFEKCIYMIYDETNKKYTPLYLFNTTNPKELITIFDRKDTIIKTLLKNFFGRHFNYHEDVQLNDQGDMEASEILPRVPKESDNTPGIIMPNIRKDASNQQMAERIENDQCLLMSNIKTKASDTREDIQLSSNMKSNISNTTHEFQIGELPGDDQCLFSSAIYLFDRSQTINIKSLRKKVANFIRKHKDTEDIRLKFGANFHNVEDYCLKIEEGIIWNSELERHALAHLYPNILFFYDATANNCMPVYLYDKINREEEKTNFKYNDAVKKLLENFIRYTFNYNGHMNFESGSEDQEVELHSNVEPESVDVLEKTAVEHSKKQATSMLSQAPKYVLKNKQEFVKKHIDRDGHCLFSSFCYVLRHLKKNAVKSLRRKVAKFMLGTKDIDDEVLLSETGKTRQEYCNEIRNTNAWGGEAEIRAVAKLFSVIVRVVNVVKVNSTISAVHITEFPENEPSFERCVYIIRVNSHYEPLFLRNANNAKEEATIFNRNDIMVKECLCEFIREKLPYNGSIEFDIKSIVYGDDLESQQKDKFMNQSNLIEKNIKKTLSKKRKTCEDDENLFMANTTNKSTYSTLCTNADNSQSLKTSRSIPSGDQIYIHHNVTDVSSDITHLLQTNSFTTLNFPIVQSMEQEQEETSSSISSSHTTISYEAQNQQIKFEIEPIEEFRGRLLSEYVPKKKNKKDGTKAKAKNPPSYFPDRHNRHYLNLLISEKLLCGDLNCLCLEIALITTMIKGWLYLNPYFKIYVVHNGNEPLTINPLYIYVGFDKNYKLTDHLEGIKSMLLYLCIIMLTHNELLQNQPIQPFQSLRSNEQAYNGKYKNYDAFKADFHLNELQFAITPWIKSLRDNEYHRLTDLQYISQPSTQNKDFKVSKANIS